MAVSSTGTYAPNYMQPWTAWFRKRQSGIGTIEEFARVSGIGVRTVATYRSGTIPRRRDALEKISRVFDGDLGPLPGSSQEVDLEERILRLEMATLAMKASMADVVRTAIATLARPDLSDAERAQQQETLNLALRMLEPTPDELLRIVEDAAAQAGEVVPQRSAGQGEGGAPPRRSS